MRLILASASPRRAELLASAGFAFEISPADVDEFPLSGEEPGGYALRVATEKARQVRLDRRQNGTVVLGADTVVVAGNRILGKPASDSEAIWMLEQLSGAVHVVVTAVVLRTGTRLISEVVSTRVHLLPLTEDEIRWYVSTREPDGKAGAYAIQGRAARFIDWIEGSWSNVVGLPLASVFRLLKEVGYRD